MPAPQQTETVTKPALGPVLRELYERSRAMQFGFSTFEFRAILDELAARHAANADFETFCSNLHIEDLVLARACAAGNERAWEAFMLRFREKLYDVSRQITREDSTARELADSVYADLYGMRTRGDERVSKLASYSGRGSLDGWLRTVLAQDFVNTYRKQRRLVSLEEESEDGAQFAATPEDPMQPSSSLLEQATADALRQLDAEDRFVLASYFLDDRTLAQIARSLSVHESTISRKIEKLTKTLRKQIVKNLIARGMSRRQAEEALTTDVRDFSLDIRSSLAQDSGPAAFSKKGVKAGARRT